MNVALPSYRVRAIHLCALWAYGVGQPVFSLLQGNPELLALRGFTRSAVVVFALSLALVPPLLAVAVEWLLSRVWPAGANLLHALLVVLFVVPLGLQLAKWVDPGTADVALILVLALSIAGAAVYLLWRPVQLFLSFSLLLPVVGLAMFVFGTPVATRDAEAADVRPHVRLPIVMLVLDELPLTSLMTRSGDVDAVRYPNFARLESDGTWYRSATTVHDFSSEAVPAILTGRRSRSGELPTLADHPENVFTFLGAAYDFRVHESWTRLCPLRRCPQRVGAIRRMDDLYEDVGTAYLRKIVPDPLAAPVPRAFAGYEGDAFEDLLHEIATEGGPGVLYFAHLLLPHAPWRLLPSGRSYNFSKYAEGLVYPTGVWTNDSWLVQQAYQRHLLQVEYTDAVVGRLLDELERADLYDRALVVIVSDHGASFRAGLPRRNISRETFADIAAVPLFIKYPHQRQTGADPRPARTIDVLPTIADVLHVDLPWPVDGRSLLRAPRRSGAVVIDGKDVRLTMPGRAVARDVQRAVGRKSALFGEGRDSLFRLGMHKRLLGARVSSDVPRSTTTRVAIQRADLYAEVRYDSQVIPARVAGIVTEGQLGRRTELAIAVNGRVQVLARGFRGAGGQLFRVLVPESALREGYNRIDVFAIHGAAGSTRLVWLGTSADGG